VRSATPVTPPSRYVDAWARRLRTCPPVPATSLCPDDGASVLAVVAHPDDEVLAMGATLAAVGRRVPVDVLCLTDGEAAVRHVGVDVPGLAGARQRELAEAGRRLGARSTASGHLPDGGLSEHLAAAAALVREHVAERGPGRVLTLWRQDPHPDHRAAGLVAARAAAEAEVPLTELPLWSLHWTDPDAVGEEVRPVVVGLSARRARRAALAAYPSQTAPLTPDLGPVLPASVVGSEQECVVVP
jgi:LmbE family N-acetylglucosaminyl deacetylase